MHRLLFVTLLALAFAGSSQAQPADSTLAPFQKFPYIPSFKLLLTDSSSWLYKTDLEQDKYTVIMYFNPDCEHCKKEVKDITANMQKLKNTQFVFVTYAAFPLMKKFYEEYRIADYPAIKMGRDPNYNIPTFYRVRFTPFVAVYDKKGNLLQVGHGGMPLEKLMGLLQ
jgi:thiol-disulfide isomerase/thioredoxin